jgi:hypothetical protein
VPCGIGSAVLLGNAQNLYKIKAYWPKPDKVLAEKLRNQEKMRENREF